MMLIARRQVRCYSAKPFTLRKSPDLNPDVQPIKPVRTRFAPSPTGFLHLGSLRTALYNYLLAKSTNGQFLLRLEDTDQKRLIAGAEQNIYDVLDWLGLKYDEGPIVEGPSSPYRQSERTHLYLKYVDQLLEKGKAYRCFCSKDRLDMLRESARALKPPTTVSYDRHCLHHYNKAESDIKAQNGEEYTVRFRSPEEYPPFQDLLHGNIHLQPQINYTDRRYDDLILLKSDSLPTYHLANVVDDHLMHITHVIRGEEWLPSTPKHIALYNAFQWTIPKFIHIPLLTTIEGKKLSKRSSDIDISSLRAQGYLKEALLNFCVLFGWSPKREQNESTNEVFSLRELEKSFNINQLTKGNAKVDFTKLEYFNRHYLSMYLRENEQFFQDAVDEIHRSLDSPKVTREYTTRVLKQIGPSLKTLNELQTKKYSYLFHGPDLESDEALKYLSSNKRTNVLAILNDIKASSTELVDLSIVLDDLGKSYTKKEIYQALRLAISGSIPGLKIPQLITLLGPEEVKVRVSDAIKYLS